METDRRLHGEAVFSGIRREMEFLTRELGKTEEGFLKWVSKELTQSGDCPQACHLIQVARFMQKLAPCGHFNGPANEEDGVFLSGMNAGWLWDLELAAIQNSAPTPKR